MNRQTFLKMVGLSTLSRFFLGCNTMQNTAQLPPNASPLPSVIVIGAGMAGLAAARSLQRQGYRVLVLEGRDRIGGRVWSDRTLKGIPLDLGASWIHGITGNPLSNITRAAGIRTIPTDYDNLIRHQTEGQVLTESEDISVDVLFTKLMNQLEELRHQREQQGEHDISLQTAIDMVMPALNLNAAQKNVLNYAINSTIEHEYASDIAQLSLNYWDDGEGFAGGDVLFPDGYDQVIEAIAAPLTIRLNHVVEQIAYDDRGVRVQTSQGNFEAAAAIVTLPLGVLKRGSVVFSPALPTHKQNAIRKLGMGVLNKVYFHFPDVFWDEDAEMLGYIAERKGEWSEFLSLYRYTQHPVLLGFNAGAYGLAIESLPDQAIVAAGMTVLRRLYGAVPEPLNVLITRWNADPLAGGSYSSIAPGATPGDRDRLAEPVGRTLFFAGEATSRAHAATVHGALLSGERAAAQVAQTLTG